MIEQILEKQDEAFASFLEYIDRDLKRIDEIVFIGSGTSSTAAMTSCPFVQKASGIRTRVVYPNDCIEEEYVDNPNALHVFTSQTGTSDVVCHVMEEISAKGHLCVSLTEKENTRLAKLSPSHICMNCGPEEYGMRTIGYTASVLNHMLLGMKLGLARGSISAEQYEKWLKEASLVPGSHSEVTARAEEWFERNKRQIMRSSCIIFTGAGALYGLALESAVKFWEMPQVVSIGYELEEGLHGPNYGYNGNHCVIVFNDGGRNSGKALSLARYMKDVFHNGLVVGCETVDETDLKLDVRCGDFACLEFSAVPQVAGYFLAEDGGRDLTKPADHSVMNSYFSTHANA